MEKLADNSEAKKQANNHHLTQKETRQIVTPYAFHVSPELFGTALAKPKKRAVAIGIDMLLIAILSQSASFVLAGVAAVTFFKAGNRLKQKKRFNAARLAMRFVAAVLLFVFAWGLFSEIDMKEFNKDAKPNISEGITTSGMGAVAMVGLTAKYMLKANTLHDDVQAEKCLPAFDCWRSVGNEFADRLAPVTPGANEFTDIMQAFVEIADEQLSQGQREQLLEQWKQFLESSPKEVVETSQTNSPLDDSLEKAIDYKNYKKRDKLADDEDDDKPKSGIIAWTKGLMEDLGLGFGWAAFYFSIFTAWLRGQTPGKKLLGIKVIKLDGAEPNLWESFGRYGGYGAGFATGLLGFLQVYWDPNRQAIQDKISQTVVIDLRIAKVPFIPEQPDVTPQTTVEV